MTDIGQLLDLAEVARGLATLAPLLDAVAMQREALLDAIEGSGGITAAEVECARRRVAAWERLGGPNRAFYTVALTGPEPLATTARVVLFHVLDGTECQPWQRERVEAAYRGITGLPPRGLVT